MAKTEMILAKMERRREMTRSACTASSQGGKSHSLQRIHYQEDFQVKTAPAGFYYYCLREAIVQKILEFYEIISQTGRGGQSDFISLIQK